MPHALGPAIIPYIIAISRNQRKQFHNVIELSFFSGHRLSRRHFLMAVISSRLLLIVDAIFQHYCRFYRFHRDYRVYRYYRYQYCLYDIIITVIIVAS